MMLSNDDSTLFYRLNPALLTYANEQLGLLKGVTTVEKFMELVPEEKIKVRNAFYDNLKILEAFIDENPHGFTEEELGIIENWKHFVRSRFLVMAYHKKYALFQEEGSSRIYGVLTLTTDFKEMLGRALPVLVETVLIPFQDKIIYDGFMLPYGISFGPGIRGSMRDSFEEEMARSGIISSLPFAVSEPDDQKMLKFYLKSRSNREMYWEEIQDLINENRNRLIFYHQEMGRLNSRTSKKNFKKIGIGSGFYAIVEGQVVAAGRTKSELEQIVNAIVPPGKREFVYVFQQGK